MNEAIVGLGGNIGDRRKNLAAAVRLLAARPGIDVLAVSPLYETPPWGKTDQPAFLNAAVRIATTLSPQALLDAILDIEALLGRQRSEKWGPRTLDLDILLYGDRIIDEPGLNVPHPRLAERAFALKPLVDVLPDATIFGHPARDLLAALDVAGMHEIDPHGWELTDGRGADAGG